MSPFLQQVLTLLTTPPGNLTYHLVLAFSLAGALQVSLNHWRRTGFPQGRRMVAGLLLLLFARLSLFLSTVWIGGTTDSSPEIILAILDRTVTAISIVLIAWLWTFPKKSRPADAGAVLFGLLVVTVSLFTIAWWNNQGSADTLNGTQVDVLWEATSLFLILIGAALLAIRRPDGWGIGMVTLALLFLGHFSHLVFPLPDANFPGSVRLTQLAAYPLLFFLPQRFQYSEIEWSAREDQDSVEPAPSVPLKDFLQSFLDIALVASPEQIRAALAKVISLATHADLTLLVLPPDENDRMKILSGYDLIHDQTLEEKTITAIEAPMLAATMTDGVSFTLNQDSTSADAFAFESILNLSRTGSILAVPISGDDGKAFMAVVLLAPFVPRQWSPADEAFLANLAPSLAGISHLVASHDRSAAAVSPLAGEIEVPLDSAGTSERVSTSLTQENVRLTKELRQARQELSQAREQLADMENKLRLAESSAAAAILSRENEEQLRSISQELRHPVASILEYVNALLADTGEAIQPAHRRILERLMRSTERLKRLVDDLVQLIAEDTAHTRKTLEPVSLPPMIDEIVAAFSSKTSHRGISIYRTFPEALPSVHADGIALSTIFTALMENACAATPDGGQVSLLVRIERGEDQGENILVQINDTGEGIPHENLPGLFSHFTAAGDRAMIPGLGDANIQLSSIKALVEDQKGRIWVDSEPGKGTTFSLLFPASTGYIPGNARGHSG